MWTERRDLIRGMARTLSGDRAGSRPVYVSPSWAITRVSVKGPRGSHPPPAGGPGHALAATVRFPGHGSGMAFVASAGGPLASSSGQQHAGIAQAGRHRPRQHDSTGALRMTAPPAALTFRGNLAHQEVRQQERTTHWLHDRRQHPLLARSSGSSHGPVICFSRQRFDPEIASRRRLLPRSRGLWHPY